MALPRPQLTGRRVKARPLTRKELGQKKLATFVPGVTRIPKQVSRRSILKIPVSGTRPPIKLTRKGKAKQIKKIRAFQIKRFGPRVGRKAARSFITGKF